MRTEFVPSARLGLALAGLLLLPAAQAQTPWSIGVEAGASRLGVVCTASPLNCDRSGTALGLHGGYAITPAWGVLLSWQSLRGFAGSDRTAAGLAYGGDLDFNVIGLAGTWRTAWPSVALELRAGVASVKGDFSYTAGATGNVAKTTTQPLLGAALEVPLGSGFAARLDLQGTRGKVASIDGDLTSLTIGVVARF
jgi:hypothetical protein